MASDALHRVFKSACALRRLCSSCQARSHVCRDMAPKDCLFLFQSKVAASEHMHIQQQLPQPLTPLSLQALVFYNGMEGQGLADRLCALGYPAAYVSGAHAQVPFLLLKSSFLNQQTFQCPRSGTFYPLGVRIFV